MLVTMPIIPLMAVVIIISTCGAQQMMSEKYQQDKVVVCYVGTWSVYRPDKGKFDIQDIDPNLCTHAVYAFASLYSPNNTIVSHDYHRDFNLKGYQEFVNLKHRNPRLKSLIAIGGWEEGAQKYSWMTDSKNNRTAFINSVVEFLRQHKFDGLDLDWEYPGAEERGGRPQDKENFVSLVKELRSEFQSRWLLTAAIGASPRTINKGYDIQTLSRYLDMIHIMSYDYHGSWDKQTGHNAPLYSSPEESPDNQKLNINETVSLLLSLGAPPQKLILGVPFYGRTFSLVAKSQWKPGSKSEGGSGRSGQYSNQTGFMGYNEFCEINMNEHWTVSKDRVQMVPYAYKENEWISYDNEDSLMSKVQFALEKHLGGIMIWSLETDDFKNTCGGGRYPLLTAVNKALKASIEISTPKDTPKDLDNEIEDTNPKFTGGVDGASSLSTLLLLPLMALISISYS